MQRNVTHGTAFYLLSQTVLLFTKNESKRPKY